MVANHKYFMRRAMELAQKARGQTSPNPIVGAVIVKKNRILSEGYHSRAGGDHAEIVALKKLRRGEAKGATLYVTLEPCCHKEKRTPSCMKKVLASGFQNIVIGMKDPNPKVAGRSIRHLRRAGVKVVTGILKKECAQLNSAYIKWITTGLPFVTLKVASTLDGKIATASGESQWITNERSRRFVHQLRSEVDAILVGAGTLRQDDPLLTVRLPGKKKWHQPMAVVVCGKKPIPKNCKLFQVKGRQVFCATAKNGKVDLKKLLKKLGQMGVTHLLVEGGGKIFSSFVAQKQVDRFLLCLAPKLLGGSAQGWLPDLHIRRLGQAPELTPISLQIFGNDLLLVYEK